MSHMSIPSIGLVGNPWHDSIEQCWRFLTEIGSPACQMFEDCYLDRIDGLPSSVVGWYQHPRWRPGLIEWKLETGAEIVTEFFKRG